MSAPVIPGFSQQRVDVAGGVALNVATGGSGSPVVLLHGFPQTHLMWRHVAVDLAAEHTVLCPALRGYGPSDNPADVDGRPTRSARWPPTWSPPPARSATTGSRWSATTGVRWSPSAPGSTTPRS